MKVLRNGVWVVVAGAVAVIIATGGGDGNKGNLWIDGDGGTCTRQGIAKDYSDAAACPTIEAARLAARCGDTVRVKAKSGGYPPQNVGKSAGGTAPAATGCSGGRAGRPVLFRPSEGETVQWGDGVTLGQCKLSGPGLFWSVCIEDADDLELRDFTTWQDGLGRGAVGIVNPEGALGSERVTMRNVDTASMRIEGEVADITVIGGKLGNDSTNGTVGLNVTPGGVREELPNRVRITGSTIGNTRGIAPGTHTECIMVNGGENVVIENSFIRECGRNGFTTADINVNRDLGNTRDITLRNNMWGNGEGDGGIYSVHMSLEVKNVTFEHNTVNGRTNLADACVACGYILRGNYSQSSGATCAAGVTYAYNHYAGNTDCGGPGDTHSPGPMAVVSGVRDAEDLHLTPGASALGKGAPSCAVPYDFDGQARPTGVPCDAGADELP